MSSKRIAHLFVFSLVLFVAFSSFALAEEFDGQPCNDSIDCMDAGLCEIASCVNGFCIYDLDDNEGPSIVDILFDNYNNGIFDIFANASDECSNVVSVAYYVGGDTISCSGDVDGYMDATDGSFDEIFEEVWKDIEYENDGSNRICLEAMDLFENVGGCECRNFETDTIPPERLLNITLNGVSDPNELLVCGDNPTLRLTVCDSESNIQGGEFFLDLITGTIPDTWTGYWLDVVSQYLSDGWHCADVEGQVDGNQYQPDFMNLTEGTHYITQIRGKDIVENWGKVYDQDFNYSFIKDTTAPKTLKTLNPFEDINVSCDETIVNGNNLTDGCFYVKQGTTITLDARDFNPDDMTDDIGLGDGYNNLPGEYAGGVSIHYIIWWSENGDNWTMSRMGGSLVDEPVTITLSEDSYHLIEYWSTDTVCGNEEIHHFELDIVDTVAPESESEIIGPYYDDGEKLYVDGVTEIALNCVDPEPHPVGLDKDSLQYRYEHEDPTGARVWTPWMSYDGAFSFPEESRHVLEYKCTDLLNNVEPTHNETYYVDHTKPVTSLVYGAPFVGSDGYAKWITSNTDVALSATDYFGFDHDSGVNFTKYRVTLMDGDGACESAHSGCSEYSGNGSWTTVTEDVTFNIPETSCHLIEYYSVDMVEKTEVLNKDCVFVDNEAPEVVKNIDGNKILMDENCTDDVCDYWITQDVQISLDCADVMPHPVGDVTLFWRWGLDGTNPLWNNESDGAMSLSPEEDCLHKLEWYCADALGNSVGSMNSPIVEMDNVDTAGPNVTRKFARVNGGDIIEGGSVGDETVVALRSEDTVKLCANVIDYKQTGDLGVGVDVVGYQFVGLGDPELFLDESEGDDAYCIELSGADIRPGCQGDCGAWRFEVGARDLLGNLGEWTNGIEIIVDNVAPMGQVLNPHSGNYYRDEVPFQVYAPAVDFGGDSCSLCDWGYDDGCVASGVDYCDLYAIDYDFEGMNQSEIKDCYLDLWTYFQQVGADPNIVYLGQVPYENGVCKGTVALPEDSGMTDTVFLGIDYVDKAGNQGNELFGYHLQLAVNPWFSPITMNIDNEGPLVTVSDSNLPGPLTSSGDGDNVFIEAEVIEYASGFSSCWAEIYEDDEGELGDYAGVADILGVEADYNLCRINGALSEGLESGDYLMKAIAMDKTFNIGNVVLPLIVDNTRPTMSAVHPLEGVVYGNMFPVSLKIEDSQSPIIDETVKFRITEIPALGNLLCIFGNCEETRWISLDEQDNGLYATTINLTEEEISGMGRYTFDAIACDNLYDSIDLDVNGIPVIAGNDRNGHHCVRIEVHGINEEPRLQCNDGIDNDLDGYIDYPMDEGCDGFDDNDESYVYVPQCNDGEDNDGDGLTDYPEDSGCTNFDDDDEYNELLVESVKINEFVSDPETGSEWIELYNPTNSAINLSGWTLNDGLSWSLPLGGEIEAYGFMLFSDFSAKLNSGGDLIKLLDPSVALVDSVAYGNWDDGNTGDNAPEPVDGQSAGRCSDGDDTDVDSDDFEIFYEGYVTPGSANDCIR
jgi:hypothetical protein